MVSHAGLDPQAFRALGIGAKAMLHSANNLTSRGDP